MVSGLFLGQVGRDQGGEKKLLAFFPTFKGQFSSPLARKLDFPKSFADPTCYLNPDSALPWVNPGGNRSGEKPEADCHCNNHSSSFDCASKSTCSH